MSSDLPISVVVRTYNSEKTLGRLLAGLDLGPEDEVIVVDSGSTDGTVALAKSLRAQVLNAPPPFNYSKSLNIGFRAVKNPWALVISSHSVALIPDLLRVFRASALHAPANIAVIYGPNTLTSRTPFQDESTSYFSGEVPSAYERYCGNGNALYRMSAWQRLPFDETIRTAEDKLWLANALRNHWGAGFCPAARTLNQSRYSLRYMFRKGYSDSYAADHRSVTLLELGLSLGSLTKLYLKGNMPTGNWLRYGAHSVGRFYGSRRPTDNTPAS